MILITNPIAPSVINTSAAPAAFFLVLIFSLFAFMAMWHDELVSALCSLGLLIPYYYILWLNKSRLGKKFSFSIKPMN